MAIQTKTRTDILRINAARPASVVIVQDPAFRSSGFQVEDEYNPTGHGIIKIKALASATSWTEVTWPEPTTVVGVQLFGDERGSWGRISVDGAKVWEGNTNGGGNIFSDYIQISGLADAPHTVRVEALGQAGTEGGPIFVGVTGFGWGEVSKENKIGDGVDVFIPAMLG